MLRYSTGRKGDSFRNFGKPSKKYESPGRLCGYRLSGAEAARNARIFDRWLACWTEEEIGKEEGMPQQTVSDLCKELPKLENLPKSVKIMADFADADFQ